MRIQFRFSAMIDLGFQSTIFAISRFIFDTFHNRFGNFRARSAPKSAFVPFNVRFFDLAQREICSRGTRSSVSHPIPSCFFRFDMV